MGFEGQPDENVRFRALKPLLVPHSVTLGLNMLVILRSHDFATADVNATMFDRYGAADDFLDSHEIKHVY